MRIDRDMAERLRCPRTYTPLQLVGDQLVSANGDSYPVFRGVPILFNSENRVFSAATVVDAARRPRPRRLGRLLPDLSWNPRAAERFRAFAGVLPKSPSDSSVLLVGGGSAGKGIEELRDQGVRIVSSDVYIESTTDVVADAHELPFADETFDGVVAQAVLEHVLDPARCVCELVRVLKPEGAIYVETPFMQQVHAGRFDFHRFSHLGHRRLLRQFDEVDSGVAVGPASALAWSYKHLLLSMFPWPRVRGLVTALAHLSAAPVKYLDAWLGDSPAALDAASALFFVGKKSECSLSDQSLLGLYRGAGEANLDNQRT